MAAKLAISGTPGQVAVPTRAASSAPGAARARSRSASKWAAEQLYLDYTADAEE